MTNSGIRLQVQTPILKILLYFSLSNQTNVSHLLFDIMGGGGGHVHI